MGRTRYFNFFIWYVIAILAGGLVGLGCSRVDVGLELAPRFIVGTVDDYFDLDSKAKSDLRGEIRYDIRKLYDCCFKSAFAEVEKEFSSYNNGNAPKESVDHLVEIYYKFRPQVISEVKPTIDAFIKSVNPKQVSYFEKEMADNIKRDESEDRADNAKKAKKNFIRNFEFFCVDLEPGQVKQVEDFFKDHQFPYDERLKVKKEFLRQVTAAKDIEQKKSLLKEYSLGEGFDRGSYQDAAKKFQRQVIDFGLFMYNGLSSANKVKCQEKIRSRFEEFRSYFAQPQKK